MALSFRGLQSKRRTHVVAIDLGGRATKAVHMHRQGEVFELLQYAVIDAPWAEKTLSADTLSDHLKQACQLLGARTKQVVLGVGCNDSLLRHAEVPMVPVGDLRLMMKYNSKNYLQQDLPDYVFDCYVLPARSLTPPGGEGPKVGQKCRVLVGGAKKDFLEMLQTAAKNAGLTAEQVTPSLVGLANSFELAQPEAFTNEVVALVDIGFKSSTICIVLKGDLSLSRVVSIGGDKLTSGLSEAMNISHAEAEGIKIGMPGEVQSAITALLMPLGRELRASIDFFEHQQDKSVSQVFVSGASAKSPLIIEALQSELMIPCKSWNPLSFVKLDLPPQQMAEIEQHAPELGPALGAAVAAF